MAGFGQFTTGIMPIPGSPAYETMLQRVANAQPIGNTNAIADARTQAANAYNALKAGGGPTYGIFGSDAMSKALLGPGGGGAGASASAGGGGGGDLQNEMLGLIRGAPQVQDEAARRRFNEDIAQARTEKTRDLTRRGLFQAGTGEMELQRDIDKPYTRGLADLEANMADENARLSLGKASILGNILAQQRRAQAEAFARGESIGTSGGGGSRSGSSGGGGGGWLFGRHDQTQPFGTFGAQFGSGSYGQKYAGAGQSSGGSTAPPPGVSGPDTGPVGPGELSGQDASNLMQMGLISQNKWTQGPGGGYIYKPY